MSRGNDFFTCKAHPLCHSSIRSLRNVPTPWSRHHKVAVRLLWSSSKRLFPLCFRLFSISFPHLECARTQVLTSNPSQSYLDESYCDMHINIMTYCHGIPNIFTALFFLWREWLPYFARVSVAFLRRWMCVCLFPFVHFLSPASVSRHLCTPLNICSSATLARCPPPVWNLRVWPLNSEPSLSFLQRCRLHSYNRGNVWY